ncbi:hypothetical protein BASA60_009007 [Batrachochytrium salamandrivorans]|nr:hypothetical protein BASA60_009007 [Batrachochytrium salamandrivorans]
MDSRTHHELHMSSLEDVDSPGFDHQPHLDVLPSVMLSEDKTLDLISALGDSSESVHDLGRISSSRLKGSRSAVELSLSDPSVTPLLDPLKSPKRLLLDIELDFKRYVLPEMEIIDTPVDILKDTIRLMSGLRKEILVLDSLDEPDSLIRDKGMLLLEQIGREMLLYEQFLDIDAAHLTLEEIMKDTNIDVDETHSVARESEGSCAADPLMSNATRLSKHASMHISTESLRSTLSVFTIPDHRRLSITSSQYLNQPHSGFNNVASANSSDSLSHHSEGAITSIPPGPNDFVKWTKLRKLSVSLFSEAFVRQVGVPTVFSASSGIAVGTSKSVILLYDIAQNLLGIIGDSSLSQSSLYGAVTAVEVSANQKQIYAGYARGHVIVWDIARRTSVKVIPPITESEQRSRKADGHLSGTPITHITKLGPHAFGSADDLGTIFVHSISRGIVFSSVSSARIHGRQLNNLSQNSLPTTIYALAALPSLSGKHTSDHYHFFAISTPYKMAIMSMRPIPQIQFRVSWDLGDANGSENSRKPVEVACLDWWAPVIHNDGKVVGRPRLAYSNRNQLSVLNISWTISGTDKLRRKVDFNIEGSCQLDENIVAIRWINEMLFICLTRSEKLVAVNSWTLTVLEQVDISSYKLLFQPVAHKSLDPFNIAVELCYGGSMCIYKSRLILLGSKEISVVSLIPWIDRIASLIRVGRFRKAFQMAVSFYHNEGVFAVVGLPSDSELCRKRVGEHVSGLILSYVSMSLSGYDSTLDEDLSTYRQVADTVFDTCISIDRLNLLFSEIYDRFVEAGLCHIFVESLESFVLSGRVHVIFNPTVIQVLISHYLSQSWLDRLEQIILHLDPTTLDIHQILLLCEQHGLHNALVYVYNKTLKDYITPLVLLMGLVNISENGNDVSSSLDQSMDTPSQLDKSLKRQSGIYTIYVYLAYALTGQAFPMGSLEPDQALKIKSDLYSFLLSPVQIDHPGTNSLNLGVTPFPYLRLLVIADVDELTKMLGSIFDSDSLDSSIPWSHWVIDDTENSFASAFWKSWPHGITRQLIVNVLLQIIDSFQGEKLSSDVSDSHANEYWHHTTILFAFLARCYSKHRKHIHLSDALLERILDALCECGDSEVKPEREVAILSIISSGGALPSVSFRLAASEQGLLLDRFEKANLWRVYEHMARTFGRYDLVLRAFLKDERRTHESFQAMRDLLDSGTLTYQQSLDVRQCILDYLIPLVELDGYASAQLISDFWPSEHNNAIASLAGAPRLAYAYLKGLMVPDVVSQKDSVVLLAPLLVIENAPLSFKPAVRSPRPLSISRGLFHNQHPHVYPESYYNRLILLMCEFEPGRVLSFLIELNDAFDKFPYNVDMTISSLRLHKSTHAAAWLLERIGDFMGAISTILDDLGSTSEQLTKLEANVESADHILRRSLRERALSLLDCSIRVCERSTLVLDAKDQRDLWFVLLTEVYFKLSKEPLPTHPKTELNSHLKLLELIPNNTDIVPDGGIAQSPAIHLGPISPLPGQMRTDLSALAVGTQSELDAPDASSFFLMLAHRIMGAVVEHVAARIIAADSFQLITLISQSRAHGFRPFRGQCESCHRLLHIRAMFENERKENLVVFSCRHTFHRTCLDKALELAARALSIEFYQDYGLWCTLCGLGRKDLHRHLKGKGKIVSKPLSDTAHGLKDAPYQLDQKFDQLQRAQNRGSPMISILQSLNPTHSPTDMNDIADVIDMGGGVEAGAATARPLISPITDETCC